MIKWLNLFLHISSFINSLCFKRFTATLATFMVCTKILKKQSIFTMSIDFYFMFQLRKMLWQTNTRNYIYLLQINMLQTVNKLCHRFATLAEYWSKTAFWNENIILLWWFTIYWYNNNDDRMYLSYFKRKKHNIVQT